ncbi:MAG: hypothetical protein IKI68_00715, partial [Clostridia bacterium]|nr:hypothetical protein [Clostridia bacterium]
DAQSTKSFVKSVDFIRKRLADIDEAYRDCIIFPTSALEYFYAVEAENAGVSELRAENKLPVEKMRDVKFAHRNVYALSWLHTHSENLDYYHGIKEISYDVFKKDSGMPALMSYVSYVAQSKAREEIVNNVTFEISAQKTKIKSILDFIANIEAFINADDIKIKKISGIINSYEAAVKSILAEKFNEDDLSVLDPKSLLKTYNGDYQKIIDVQRKALKSICDKKIITEAMFVRMVETIWNRVKDAKEIDGNEIDGLFGSADFKEIANAVSKETFDEATQHTLGLMRILSREVKQIVSRRQEALKQASEKCRDALAKENVCIILPELPEFEFAAAVSDPGEIIVKVNDVDLYIFDKLSELFTKNFFGNIWNYFKKNVFRSATGRDYKREFTASRDEFVKTCRKELYDAFVGMVYKNDIVEKLYERVNACVIDDYMVRLIEELQNGVEEMKIAYLSCMMRFKQDISGKIKADIENHNTYQANIEEISACTRAFMETWSSIMEQ